MSWPHTDSRGIFRDAEALIPWTTITLDYTSTSKGTASRVITRGDWVSSWHRRYRSKVISAASWSNGIVTVTLDDASDVSVGAEITSLLDSPWNATTYVLSVGGNDVTYWLGADPGAAPTLPSSCFIDNNMPVDTFAAIRLWPNSHARYPGPTGGVMQDVDPLSGFADAPTCYLVGGTADFDRSIWPIPTTTPGTEGVPAIPDGYTPGVSALRATIRTTSNFFVFFELSVLESASPNGSVPPLYRGLFAKWDAYETDNLAHPAQLMIPVRSFDLKATAMRRNYSYTPATARDCVFTLGSHIVACADMTDLEIGMELSGTTGVHYRIAGYATGGFFINVASLDSGTVSVSFSNGAVVSDATGFRLVETSPNYETVAFAEGDTPDGTIGTVTYGGDTATFTATLA